MRLLFLILMLYLGIGCQQTQYEQSEYQSALQKVFNKNNKLVQQTNWQQMHNAQQRVKTQKHYLPLVEATQKINEQTEHCLRFMESLKQENNFDKTTRKLLKDSLIQLKNDIKGIVKEVSKLGKPFMSITSGAQDSLVVWVNNHLPTDTFIYPINKNVYLQSIENQINMAGNVANDFLFDKMGNFNIHSFWASELTAIIPTQVVRKGDIFEADLGISYAIRYGQVIATIDGKKIMSNDGRIFYKVVPKRLGKHFYTVHLEVENLTTQEIDTISRTFYYEVNP